jgi:superfamily II DNA or RNA helicase
MITVRINNNIEISKVGLDERTKQHIKNMMTFKDPNNTQNLYLFYKENDSSINVPRGVVLGIKKILSSTGKPIKWVSKVCINKKEPPKLEDLNISLRDYQKDCVGKMLTKVQGIVQMPCGAGKTTTGATAMILSGQSGLVLTHTKEILEQWVSTIEKISGIKCRNLSSTQKNINWIPLRKGEIAVAMIQTVSSKLKSFEKQKVRTFLQSVGCVMTDEAHHIPAEQWRAIVTFISARFRWGLTATPERSDGLGFMLNIYVGPLLFKISTKFLITKRYLQSPMIVPVKTGYKPSKNDYGYVRGNNNSLNYTKAVSSLCRSKKRNKIICDIAAKAKRTKRQTLILVSRKSNADLIQSRLECKFVTSAVMTGDTKVSNRRLILKSFKSGKIQILIATQLADEGLDVPNIDCIIAASPAKHQARVLQRVGRSLRLGSKEPIIFDLVDEQEFRSQFFHRRRAYTKEYGNIVLPENTLEQALFLLDQIYQKFH